MNKIQPQDWNCIVCLSVMDGKNEGLISVIKRCSHIFHESCIKQWIDKGEHNCPLCKLENVHTQDIIQNDEYAKQYQKWEANPEDYSYEKAFHEEYPNSEATSSSAHGEIDYKSILLPRELRGLQRRNNLTQPEAFSFMKETKEKLIANINGKKDDLERLTFNAFKAQDVAIDNIIEDFKRIFKEIAHNRLADSYDKKVDSLHNKISQRLSRAINSSWIEQLSNLSTKFFEYQERIRVARQRNENSEQAYKEVEDRLKVIDQEFDAFIESQPRNIKNILREDPISSVENNVQVDRPTSTNGIARETVIKIALVAIGIFMVYKLLRSQAVHNFFNRDCKDLTLAHKKT